MTTTSVKMHNGLPTLFLNEKPIPPTCAHVGPAHAATFQAANVLLYTNYMSQVWWIGPNQYDFSEIDSFLSEYLGSLEGYFMPRINLGRQGYPWWGDLHPDEMNVLLSIATGQVLDTSEPDPRAEEHLHHAQHLKGLNLHSFHSDVWREEAGRAVAALVSHCEAQPYGERIWAWQFCDGWPIEWFHWSEYSMSGLADYSPAAQHDFRRWLRQTYDNDGTQLRAAWGRDVDFDSITIPDPSERERRSHGEFYDPVQDRPTIDYVRCLNDAMADSLIAIHESAKSAMVQPKVTCVYYGYPFCHLPRPQLNGHNALAKVLASPAVDAIASPHSYDNRGEGGYHSPQSMADVARRAGKIHFDEVDLKTVWAEPVRWKDNISHATTVESTIEMMKKDGAYSIVSASGMWWHDLFGEGWFDAPEAIEPIKRLQEVEAELMELGRSSFGEVALIVSEQSPLFQAPRDGLVDATHEIFRNWHLSRMGAPFEQLLLSDLYRADLPPYKLYIMADTFYLSEQDREVIQRVAQRNDATILWVYAPGFLDDRSASLQNMEKITGMRFGMQPVEAELDVQITDGDHPIVEGLSRISYGTGVDREQYLRPPKIQYLPDTRVSPAFYVDDDSTQVLGLAMSTGKAGLVVKDMGTWRSVYSAAPVLSWKVMRNIARWAGVNIYSEMGDMVWGNDKLLVIYSQSEGQRTVRFPRATDVRDAYKGELLARGVDQIELTMRLWETRLLYLS